MSELTRRDALKTLGAAAGAAGLAALPATWETATVEASALPRVSAASDPPQQTLFSEGFEGATAPALPAGWTQVPSGDSRWQTTTTSSHGAVSHAGALHVAFTFSTAPPTPVLLARTSDIDFRNRNNPTLYFWLRDCYTSDLWGVQVRASTNGGSTWQNIGAPVLNGATNSWVRRSVSLASLVGQSAVRIGLLPVEPAVAHDITVDDIELVG